MKIVYFAWVRERIGEPFEMYDGQAQTIAELVEELKSTSEAHALAFAEMDVLRFALDQKLVSSETPLSGAAELAIFPPMTGG